MNLRNIKLEDYSEEVRQAYSFPDEQEIKKFKGQDFINKQLIANYAHGTREAFCYVTLALLVSASVYVRSNLGGKVIRDRAMMQRNPLSRALVRGVPFLGLGFTILTARRLLTNKVWYRE